MCGRYRTRRKTFARAKINLVHLEGKMKGLRARLTESPWADGDHPCGCNIGFDILAVVNFGIPIQMLRFGIGWLQFRGIPVRRTG